VRAYSESSEEALRARDLLKDWAGEGFLTQEQHRRMEQETVCDLRRTNIFLRLVLFLFTLIIVGAAVALFFDVFVTRATVPEKGILTIIFAPISYAAAEFAISRFRLYRYGIEEALATCSVAFLCLGMQDVKPAGMAAAGAIASLWIWRRFGLPYALPAAMIFVLWMPDSWTGSTTAHHLIVAAFYAAGLIAVAAVRSRYRLTYLNDGCSIAEALLWLGIYFVINLQLSAGSLLGYWWGDPRPGYGFSRPFYWTTWVLIWCLPPVILARGVRGKDRWVIAAGAIATILTLVTNKPYLGWQRHTWDPMILGAVLIAVALVLSRWLAAGPSGIRHGFTARRLSGQDKQWMNVGAIGLGVVSADSIALSPQADSTGFHPGGGDSGGGGASSDF